MKPINNIRSMVSWWRSLEPNRDDLRRESRSNITNETRVGNDNSGILKIINITKPK